MSDVLLIRVFDVEHGACTMLTSSATGRLAMIDSGDNATTGWRPSVYIRQTLSRSELDFLFVTNADQDHLSDLEGLWDQGVKVTTLYRNKSPNPTTLRAIKEEQCELSKDIERYLMIHESYNVPATLTFDGSMGGATCKTFANSYPEFVDTNNLSLAVFVKYGPFKMLFPGDLEDDGWEKHLRNPAFIEELKGTTILMASHHGRDSGFCADLFRHFVPQAVVISDKPIIYETQETVPDYRAVVDQTGIVVSGQTQRRHVLTTRRDGDILFQVFPNGDYNVFTIPT
jgi:beta-lactamase superfamily II metal-dependent hydrolase